MLKAALFKLQREANKEIEAFLQKSPPSKLLDPIKYCLLSRGKRLRPILTKLMAMSVGKNYDTSAASLAIEIFHTASLIADDLPCMDDDDKRRGKESLHKKYGESTALLVSYALLVEGFSLIEKSGANYEKNGYGPSEDACNRVCKALKETARLSGANGAVLGQYLDLEEGFENEDQDFEELYYLKTGTLFQGAFTLGYIFGGGDLQKLHLVEKLSRHLGFAFQVRDDLEDLEEEKNSYAKVHGKEKSIKRCKKEIEGFYEALDALSLDKSYFQEIISFLFPAQEFPQESLISS